MTHGGGYGVVLFNLDEKQSQAVTVSVDGLAKGSSLALTTYGKAQYDQSRKNVWAGPVSKTKGKWHGPFTLNLPPWSMTAVVASP
jgi:hypothetical protein